MSACVVRGDRLAARKVGGEMVVLSADDSSLFVLNEVATAIWEAADGQRTVDEIADEVCREYDVDRETALTDVAQFVAALAAAGVVTIAEDSR